MAKTKFQNLRLFAISSAIFLAGISFFVGKFNSGKDRQRDLSRFTTSVSEGRLPSIITANGDIQAQKSIKINPKRQGFIEEVYVKEGQLINKNENIAKLEGRDYKFRLNEAIASFEKEKSAYIRRQDLFKNGAISADVFDEYLKNYLTSQARLNQLKVEGEELLVKAPFKGIITSKYAESGSFVAPSTSSSNTSTTLVKNSIVELSQGLEVIAKVPESDIGRLEVSQLANIRIEAFPDEVFESKIVEISPRANKENNVTSFNVKLYFLEEPKKIRIGMTSEIEFLTGKTSIKVLVPTVAIVTENGEPGLFVVGENNNPKFKKVELGSSSSGKTAINNGIEPGELIFIDLPPWSKGK